MPDAVSFKNRRTTDKSYFNWRKLRAKEVVSIIEERFRRLEGAEALDIGCGYGALADALADKGVIVTAIDCDIISLCYARQFVKNKRVTFTMASAEELKFHNNEYDIVFLFDVIEHVRNPTVAIREAIRVLKPGGVLYIEFSPYYSIVGHHLYDITFLPIHILPKHLIKWIVYSMCPPHTRASDLWQSFNELNKLRLVHLQQLVKSLKPLDEQFLVKYPNLFTINLPVLNWLGPFKDTLTFSYVGLFEKLSA